MRYINFPQASGHAPAPGGNIQFCKDGDVVVLVAELNAGEIEELVRNGGKLYVFVPAGDFPRNIPRMMSNNPFLPNMRLNGKSKKA